MERLPRGYSFLRPNATITPTASVELAQVMLDTAVRTGDARLAERANGLLESGFRKPIPPDVLKLLARAAQYRHDFDRAKTLLDQAISARPRDAHARLYRAQISLIQGEIRRARADCAGLILGIDAATGELCLAAVNLRTGHLKDALKYTSGFLEGAAEDQPYMGYALAIRAQVALRCRDPDADYWFTRSSKFMPGDVHALAASARSLRAMGRPALVRTMLAPAQEHDGLHLQAALASMEAGGPDAENLKNAQSRRYRQARAAGLEPELRDEAEFHLLLMKDPATALTIAQKNFETQRDHEDVAILSRAARAAGRQDVVTSLSAWQAAQGILGEPYQCSAR